MIPSCANEVNLINKYLYFYLNDNSYVLDIKKATIKVAFCIFTHKIIDLYIQYQNI